MPISPKLLLGLALVPIFGVVLYLGWTPPAPRSQNSAARVEAIRVPLLGDLARMPGLSDQQIAVVLHPAATGGEMLAITDPEAIRTAASAYFTRKRRIVEPVKLFGQPLGPVIYDKDPFVTIYADSLKHSEVFCYVRSCRPGLPERDISPVDFAGLLDHARPATQVEEVLTGTSAQMAAHAAALRADPRNLFSNPPRNFGTTPYPGTTRILLPAATSLPQTTTHEEVAEEMTAQAARLEALLTEKGIACDVYAITGMGLISLTLGDWMRAEGLAPPENLDRIVLQRLKLYVRHHPEDKPRLDALAPAIRAAFPPEPPVFAGGPEGAPFDPAELAVFDLEIGPYHQHKHSVRYIRIGTEK